MTTRATLAARLARDLSALVLDAGWSDTPTPDQAEGHYTDPLDDGLRSVGLSDLALASTAQVEAVRLLALVACYDRLGAYYAVQVDLKVGQRDEKASQAVAAIARLRAVAAQDAAAALTRLAVTTRPPTQSVTAQASW